MKQKYESPFVVVKTLVFDICTASNVNDSVEGEVFDSDWGL